MEDISAFRLWIHRTGFLGIGLVSVLWSVIPFDLSAEALPDPDLFYCLTMAFLVRRPEYVPIWTVFVVFFMRDVLTLAPLGLSTLMIIIASEVVRTNVQAFREYIFGLEWLWVATMFTIITLIQNTVLTLTFADTPRLVEQVPLILFTVLAYPVIVWVIRYVFRITRPRPGESDAWGKRL